MNKKLQAKNKNLVKGTALAFATVLVAGSFPVINSIESADAAVTDKTIYLLEAGDGKVDVGNKYTIRTAYLDKTSKLPIGLSSYDPSENVSESTVEVTYTSTGEKIAVTKDADADIKSEVSAGNASAMTYGSFQVDNVGTYVVSYSITVNGQKYSMDFEVVGSRSVASMSFDSNSEDILPTVYDVTYDKAKNEDGSYKDIVLPLPNVLDIKDENVPDVKYYAASEAIPSETENYVVVSVVGPMGASVALTNDNGKIKIDGSKFNPDEDSFVGLGDYSISYRYYTKSVGESHSKSQFITSSKKTFSVKKDYYKNYKLTVNQNGATSFVTGVESSMPTISATASFENNLGAATTENVNIKYSVKVFRDKSKNDWTEEHTDKIVDGKFTPPVNGEYRFYFTVTDFYGNTKEFNNLTVAVKDTRAPEVFMYDASDSKNYIGGDLENEIKDYIDASSKLATKTAASNLVIYAVGAKDNASTLENIKLTRTIRNSSSATIEITEYNKYNLIFNYNHANLDPKTLIGRAVASKSEAEADTWLKDNKYLKVISSISEDLKTKLRDSGVVVDKDAEGYDLAKIKEELVKLGYAYIELTHTITGSNSGVSYTVTYQAKDEADKTASTDSYSVIVLNKEVEATVSPKIEFKTTLATSYSKGDTISFEEPTASDEIDSRMEVITTYEFLKANKEVIGNAVRLTDKYEIVLENLPENTAYVRINVSAENDFGFTGIFSKEIKIADINDNRIPSVKSASGITGTMIGSNFEQNSVVTLPTIVYEDDYVAIMNAKVSVYLLGEEGKKSPVTAFDSSSVYDTWEGTYTLKTGKVIPAVAGKYEVVVTVNDPAKNFVSSYFYFTVDSIEEDYVKVNTSKSINGDGKAVVGEQFSFDIPSLSYSLKTGNKIFGLTDDVTNTAEHYSIEFVSGPALPTAINQTTYVAKEPGTYTFKYVVKYAVYDSTLLAADERGVYYEGIGGTKYYAKGDYAGLDSSTKDSLIGAYKEETAESEVIKLTVSDSTEAKTYEINFTSEGGYSDSYALNDEITIYSVGGDANIDKDQSTVTINYEGPTSSVKSYTLAELSTTTKYKLSGNGVYTITYKVVDANGREYQPINGEKSYVLRVGDSEKPQVAFKENFVKDTYSLNEELIIDIEKILLSDNGIGTGTTVQDNEKREALLATMKITVSRKDDNGNWIEVDNNGNADEKIYKYILDTAGEYKIKVTVKDSVLWEGSQEKSFTVSTQGKDNTISTQTIGTILIVLSVLILVGVIAYFVISKIKADKKSTKKINKKK